MHVMLSPNRGQTTFRRSVGDEVLVFTPGEPLELTDEQCRAVAEDLGAALVLASVVQDGSRTIVKSLWNATHETVVELAKQKQELGEPLKPHQLMALKDDEMKAKEVAAEKPSEPAPEPKAAEKPSRRRKPAAADTEDE